ncbi:DUF1835 domain-containing protein [Chryseobacterium sp. JUb7]|uniref:DUF1835 domain-containing protein n=1 Tax=Chryseobacterium sp. JUb7 TaxID=2940599 RepID=UPI002169CA1A|nr:DUF1835 domain-containing protein [Chryseobacterium sp. JUb7]MCS3530879.1 hypothetical protein [Chryseobacterium sp. JUb7]
MIDPKKAVHLVYGSSGSGILNYYFKTNFPDDEIHIHCIYNDLTTGPLTDFTSETDYEAYISYWKTIDRICHQESTENEESHFEYPELSIEFSINFPENQPLIIWHGSDAGEKLMLYRYCHLLQERNLFEINSDEWAVNSEIPDSQNRLGKRNPELLNGILNLVKKINDDDKNFYAEEWERLKKDQKSNRILKNDRIISVDEDYYDQNLLSLCTSEYQNAARIIGETMGQQESTVGDHYLFYRIHVLIDQNLLECKGNSALMRDLEIRKK